MILQLVLKWLTKVTILSSLQNESPSSGSGTSHKIYGMQLELFQSNIQSIFFTKFCYVQQYYYYYYYYMCVPAATINMIISYY
jgi:hypothetical protein